MNPYECDPPDDTRGDYEGRCGDCYHFAPCPCGCGWGFCECPDAPGFVPAGEEEACCYGMARWEA